MILKTRSFLQERKVQWTKNTPTPTHPHFVKRKLRLQTDVPFLMRGSNWRSDIYKNKRGQILELTRRNESKDSKSAAHGRPKTLDLNFVSQDSNWREFKYLKWDPRWTVFSSLQKIGTVGNGISWIWSSWENSLESVGPHLFSSLSKGKQPPPFCQAWSFLKCVLKPPRAQTQFLMHWGTYSSATASSFQLDHFGDKNKGYVFKSGVEGRIKLEILEQTIPSLIPLIKA